MDLVSKIEAMQYAYQAFAVGAIGLMAAAGPIAGAIFDVRNRNKTYLEKIVSTKEVEMIRQTLADRHGVSIKEVKIGHEEELDGEYSTQGEGGYLRKIPILVDGEEVSSLYLKIDPNQVNVPKNDFFPFVKARRPWTPTDVGTLVQSYFTAHLPEEERVDYIPLAVSTHSFVGSLSEEVSGETLESELRGSMVLPARRQIFQEIVDKLYELNELASDEFKKTVQDRQLPLSGYAMGAIPHMVGILGLDEAEPVIGALGLREDPDLCHGDLHTGNVVGDNIIDWSFAQGNELYTDVFRLQSEMGLLADDETNSYIDAKLEARYSNNIEGHKLRMEAKSHLMMAALCRGYMERGANGDLEDLHRYHLLSAAGKLFRYAGENSPAVQLFGKYVHEVIGGENDYSALHERFASGFGQGDTLQEACSTNKVAHGDVGERYLEGIKKASSRGFRSKSLVRMAVFGDALLAANLLIIDRADIIYDYAPLIAFEAAVLMFGVEVGPKLYSKYKVGPVARELHTLSNSE
jgi:hypothetical protein